MKYVVTKCMPPGWFTERATNIWFGVSVENQRTADERIPILLDTPAAVRFVSVEPLLTQTDIQNYLGIWQFGQEPTPYLFTATERPDGATLYRRQLDWVIVGGESGPDRRLFDVAWAADILHQCQEAEVPCFLKQDSALYPGKPLIVDGREWHEWPEGGA